MSTAEKMLEQHDGVKIFTIKNPKFASIHMKWMAKEISKRKV